MHMLQACFALHGHLLQPKTRRNDVQLQDAAAVMLQGLTAQYLLDGTVRLERNDTVPTSDYPNVYLIQHLKTCFSDLRSPTRARQVLVHAAAGGTGRL